MATTDCTDSTISNGNLLPSGVGANIYGFENHLVQRGGVTIVYDGDGNRVKETVAGVTTSYLVADQNPTGYAQVLDELQGGAVTRTYSYGLELINERQTIAGTLTTSFYGYDGHGSVRFLTDSTDAITDTYDYDAFGNLISSTGSTPNNYLFAGEQFDSALGIYYNRARYYDQRQGRFWTMDGKEASKWHPGSIHRYVYSSDNPINRADPSGNDDIVDLAVSTAINGELESMPTATVAAEHALANVEEIAEVESNLAEAEDLVFKGGRAAEEYLETTLQGEGQVEVQTSQGLRIMDVVTEDGEAAESKVGYVRYSQRVLTQIEKDAEILSRNLNGVKDISWNFFRSANTGLRGADPRIITALLNAGIKVIFH